MTTARQIEANRKNALKSTGPKTEEGKRIARMNAWQHGLAGQGVVAAPEDAGAVAARLEAWRDNYEPVTDEENWLYQQVVVNSVMVDRCQREAFALADYHARRAADCWEADRAAEAEELGRMLAKNPPRVLARLAATRHGCDWLIARWRDLASLLEEGRAWDGAQLSMVSDLVGCARELRDPSDTFGAGPGSPEGLELARTQIERLERRKAEALDDLDDFERGAAEAGVPVVVPRSLKALRRYEAACLKRYEWARDRLKEAGRVVDRPRPAVRVQAPPPPSPSASSPVPVTVTVPAPLPAPEPPPRSRDAVAPAAAPARLNRKARRALERRASGR